MDSHSLENDATFMDKYSRQIGTFGIDTMAKLIRLRVLIVGLRGVGMECAKNLILAGPCSITLHDDGLAVPRDLGTNFFLENKDIGSPRARSIAHKLAELNKMVTVSVHEGPLTENIVGKHDVVVFTQTKRQDLLRWNAFCRSFQPSAIGFIFCDVRGAMGYAFTDFGESFRIHDVTGEAPITRIITNITCDEHGFVSILGPDDDGKRHKLPDSDHDGWINISDVKGMRLITNPSKSINDLGPFRAHCTTKKHVRDGKAVEIFDPYCLRIGDTACFTPYDGGGTFTQHKKPYTIQFRSLKECLVSPIAEGEFGLMFTDGSKIGRAEQLHIAMWSLLEFEEQHGRLPIPHNADDCQKVLEIAEKGIFEDDGEKCFTVEELDMKVIKQAALFSDVELQPLSAFFGGVIAQEVVKFTGKFTPLKQWFHFDAFEVLPNEVPTDTATNGSRYDHIIQVYGKQFFEQLANVRTFLVGCGALGCEYLKNFAMIGLACGSKGLITVTDNDRIEISNLNRQFLFRDHNVGQSKSVAATNAVQLMNPDLKVRALELLVAHQTESTFHDQFWSELDVITNALDNVTARLYVDSKCVAYKRPLLESGTLGTKCNVQVVIPYETESYSDGPKDAEDDNIPMCTLRNFPSTIEHCIEWARAQFEDQFVAPFAEAKKFTENRSEYLRAVKATTLSNPHERAAQAAILKEIERLEKLKVTLSLLKRINFEFCVQLAIRLLNALFRERVLQLIHNFPKDHLTSSGERFWSGAKRFPQAIQELDMNDPLQLAFVRATANIFAVCFGLTPPPDKQLISAESPWRNPETFAALTKTNVFPQWHPSCEKIAASDEDLVQQEKEKLEAIASNDTQSAFERQKLINLLQELEELDLTGSHFEPADFEKDQDMNFHIDFIYSASNLRAWNYCIYQASRHKCKMIAGKIIPAIATTTAAVTGLAMLEMLKLVQKKALSAYKDSSNSLALNLYLMQEPAPALKAKDEYDVIEMSYVKCKPPGFTKWDSTVINVPTTATLQDFLDSFHKSTGLHCDLLFHHVAELGSDSKGDAVLKSVSGLILYDRNAISQNQKDLFDSQLQKSFKEWVETRYQGLVDCNSHYIELQISCSDDEDVPHKVPTVMCRFV